jgi:predicted nucleic-acid-binding protein
VRIAIDTNVLVRYLTWDDEAQASQATTVIETADEVVIPTIVLCELVWVLTRAYRYKPADIVPIMERMVLGHEFEVDEIAVRTGLRVLAAGGDFADGVILSAVERASCDHLATFDRALTIAIGPGKVLLLGS